MIDEPLHQDRRQTATSQGDRGFHMGDDDLARLTLIVSEHDTTVDGQFVTLSLRPIDHDAGLNGLGAHAKTPLKK
jgi:hypothetical protein